MLFRTRVISALEKVRCCPRLDADEVKQMSALRGERLSFQVALNAECPVFLSCVPVEGSPFSEGIAIREVRDVPCYHPSVPDDGYVIAREPCLLPDPLFPLHELSRISRGNWHSLWVTVQIPRETRPGVYTIALNVTTRGDNHYWNEERHITLPVTVVDAEMPARQELRFTNWFYVDAMAHQHHVACWSEEFWKTLRNYFANISTHGGNMVLTPLWTVPLGTAQGKERPDSQLLVIFDEGGERYRFDFSRLERWIDTAREAGIETFEMAHAYTQWGAEFTPKIIIETPDGPERRFGWHVAADSALYRNFLRQLMPALVKFLRGKHIGPSECYFHISDEPSMSQIDRFRAAAEFFTPLVEEFPVIDALSDIDFYREGIIQRPIPSTAALGAFTKANIRERWTYYCGGTQCMPNRYIGLPSLRNRIIGLILYFHDINGGFLHWGYNAWYARMSWTFDLDMYREVDWCRYGQSGCGFLVYPGEGGPIDSLRHEVFFDAVQDYRALRLLEQKMGRDTVVKMINEAVGYEFDMRGYPRNDAWFLKLREQVNHELGRSASDNR